MTAWRTVVGLIAGALSGGTALAGYQDAVLAHYELADLGATVVVRGVAGANRSPGEEEYFVFFQFEGVLWCYTPGTGTWVYGPAPAGWPPSDQQVLQWVKATDASFHKISIYRHIPAPVAAGAELPHGCVVACLAQISNLLIQTGTPDDVGLVLLSYDRQRNPAEGVGPLAIGHSILVYRYQGQWFCFDPRGNDPPKPLAQVAVGARLDPVLQVLVEKAGCRLAHARLLLISHRTLDQMNAAITWRLWSRRVD
jgi:hypothetical protein